MTADQIRKSVNSSWKFRLFLLWKLPSLFFWRIKVVAFDENHAAIRIPFTWATQNPFRSIYFSALLGAGELSSGLLALSAIGDTSTVSMLVTEMRASFIKKAKGAVTFTCNDGKVIRSTILDAIETGQGQEVTVFVEGKLPDGEIACTMEVTWSFKAKSKN